MKRSIPACIAPTCMAPVYINDETDETRECGKPANCKRIVEDIEICLCAECAAELDAENDSDVA